MALVACPECQHEVSDTAATCPSCGHQLRAAEPSQPPRFEHAGVTWAAIISAGAVIIGSFLPWVSMTAAFVGQINMAGTSGDGVITLIVGAVVAAVAGTALARKSLSSVTGLIVLLGFGLVGYIAISDMTNLNSSISEMEDDLGVASIGTGLMLVTAGAVLGAIAGIVILRNVPKKASS